MDNIFYQTMHIDLLGEVPVLFGMGVQIIMALILGGLVGFDREQKMKAAGLKTNILICLGATLYTSVSYYTLVDSTAVADPNRVAAQIVSGIGFLGAGAIIQGRGNVTGLTTAATIWVVAAIGYTIGVGHVLIATLFSLTVLVVLKLLGPVHNWMERDKGFKYYHLEILSRGNVKPLVDNVLAFEKLDLVKIHEEKELDDKHRRILNVYIETHPRILDRIITEIETIIRVEKVAAHGLCDNSIFAELNGN